MTKLLGRAGSGRVMVADTTMVTIGSQASGLIGLKICTRGLKAALNPLDRPQTRPSGTATTVAKPNPKATVNREVKI